MKEFCESPLDSTDYESEEVLVKRQSCESIVKLQRRTLADIQMDVLRSCDVGEDAGGEEVGWETRDKGVFEALLEKKRLDVIPGSYEGGLKTWECSLDLVAFMADEIGDQPESFDFSGKQVAEIGCGSGLPGVWALMQGSKVDFFDFVSADPCPFPLLLIL